MSIKNIGDLKIPDEFKETHFAHQLGDDWYLVPNDAPKNHGDDKEFECWLFNTNGTLALGLSYMMKAKELGF